VPVALLAELAGADADWVVPRWSEGLEPLCALWGPAALAVLAQRAEHGLYALHELAGDPGLKILFLEGERLAAFGRPEEIFWNVNTPDDLPP
jgi:molybdopterin-guanine dinucleotide biosynthesis protein A